MTQHVPLYNGTTGADTTQLLPKVVPAGELKFPRHSNKQETSYSGYMQKHTGLSDKWEKRWFVLEGGFLKYFYEKDGKGINALPKGVIPMASYTVHEGDDDLQRRNTIILKPIFPGDHEYRLALESAFQKRTWTGKLATGSHKGRVKALVVGPEGVGKTCLVHNYFENRTNEVELSGSNPSLGSHVGYVPAPESHRRDLVMNSPHCNSVVSLECWENPGRGDWAHVRQNLYQGADVVLGVFSTADRASLTELERVIQVEVNKLAVNVPIFLVGTKTDLRDTRSAEPVVGHAQAGSRGHLTPRQRQEFNCVTFLEGKEAALRMGAVDYEEACAFNKDEIASVFGAAAQYGLAFRNPGLPGPRDMVKPGHLGDIVSAIDRKYNLYADERSDHLRNYELEPRRSKDRYPDSTATATSGEW